jgi:hypothetical protein
MADLEALRPSADRHDLELRAGADLERLPGVIAAAVWLDSEGHLRDARLHIMPGATPTIIVNAAARVLQTAGIPFGPGVIRTISLALPAEIEAIALPSGQGGRLLLLQDLSLRRVDAHVTCRVQLVREGNITVGEAQEIDTSSGRARAAAAATLRAAEASADGLALGLEAAAIMPIFGRSHAVVAVEAVAGRRVASLSALVPVDPARAAEEAISLATLRAIDRWIGL